VFGIRTPYICYALLLLTELIHGTSKFVIYQTNKSCFFF